MLEAHKYHCSVRVLYPTRLCLQCACDSLKKNFLFRFIAASLACILVRLLSNAYPVSVRVASRKKKNITNGTKQPSYREREPVLTFFFSSRSGQGMVATEQPEPM